MATKTVSHTFSTDVSLNGSKQHVPNPTNPASNQLAGHPAAIYSLRVPIVFGTASYHVYLPVGALLRSITYTNAVAFSGGTSPGFSVGSTSAATDIATSVAFSAGNSMVVTKIAQTANADTQSVFVNLTGAPAAGSGNVYIEYVNS